MAGRQQVTDTALLEVPSVIGAEVARYGFTAVAAMAANRRVLVASRTIAGIEKRVLLGGFTTITSMSKRTLVPHIAAMMHAAGEVPPLP